MVVGLWVASRWFILGVSYRGTSVHAALFVLGGNCTFWIERGQHPMGVFGTSLHAESRRSSGLGYPSWEWNWPSVGPGDVGGLLSFHTLLPLWSAMTPLLVPTIWLWLRDRRHPPGSCARCGYDLSGTPSGTCPECGAAPGERGAGAPRQLGCEGSHDRV